MTTDEALNQLSAACMIPEDEQALAVVRAELTRLRAIVEKLPKTADGVPITPGMWVWFLLAGLPEQAHFVTDYVPSDGSAYYSTRESAEAAKERA